MQDQQGWRRWGDPLLNCQKSDRSVQFHTDELRSAMDKKNAAPPIFSAVRDRHIYIELIKRARR